MSYDYCRWLSAFPVADAFIVLVSLPTIMSKICATSNNQNKLICFEYLCRNTAEALKPSWHLGQNSQIKKCDIMCCNMTFSLTPNELCHETNELSVGRNMYTV